MIERDGLSPVFDVFISYAVADKDVVAPFVTALKRDGFQVWIDYEQMAGGVPVMDQLADGISQSAHMIVCLSDAYLSRRWTKAELGISVTSDPDARDVRTIPAVFRPLTVEIPRYLSMLTICDLTNVRNDYEQQYRLVTKMIRRRIESTAPGKEAIGEICAAPFEHADQPERALFEAYRAYRELCSFLYRQKVGDIPAHVDFRWITDRLMMRSSLPAEIRDALATMEGYGRQVVPGYVDGPAVTAETIVQPLKTLATLTEWVFPDWQRPDEAAGAWELLPVREGGTRSLPGTDYVLRAPIGRVALGTIYHARDTGRDRAMTVVLVEPPPVDERVFRQQITRFDQRHRGVLVAEDGGELVVDGRRLHYLAMAALDGACAENIVAHAKELPSRAAHELVLGIAEILRGLHEADPPVMHGDVVLANVIVGALGTVTLCPGRSNAETSDLAALATLLKELAPGETAERLVSCPTAARACQILRTACRDLPPEGNLGSVYRRYRKTASKGMNTETVTRPSGAGRDTQLVESCRIDSRGAWPLGDGRLVVWERRTDTLVVVEGEETLWRDAGPVLVRRVAHGPDGRLAIGGWDGEVRGFADGTLAFAARMDGAIGDLCFVGDGLVAGSWKQHLWRLTPDGRRQELLDVKAGVHRIAAADAHDRFAVADLSGGLAIYSGDRTGANMPAVGFVTDLAYAGTRLVLLTGEALTSVRLDGSIGGTEARPGARRLLRGSAPGHCTLVVETAAGPETWLIDEADRHVRDRAFPAGHRLAAACGVAGRFIVSDPGGGYAYWRDGEQKALWPNATSASIARDGRLVAVSRPGVVELYEDLA